MSYQREFAKKLRVAIVGIGSHAYRNLLPALNYLPVELVAICNRSNLAMAEATAAQYGCRSYQSTAEMYQKENLDAVFLCTSPTAYPKMAIEAFAAGLHVWMEKPAAMHTEEVLQMIEQRKNKVALVGYKKAFMPATRKAIEIASSPQYGGLQSMLAVYPLEMPTDGAKALRENTSCDWLNNGCHPLSVLLSVGGKVDSVLSVPSKFNKGVHILQFKNGVVGNLHLASGPLPNDDYHFYASKWHLHIDNTTRVILERGIPSEYGKTTSFIPQGDDTGAVVWEAQNSKATLENKALFVQGIYDEMMYFCSCILNNITPTTGSLEFALEIGKVYEALLVSKGNTIKIN